MSEEVKKYNGIVSKTKLFLLLSFILISCQPRETVFLVASDLHFDSTVVKTAVFVSVIKSIALPVIVFPAEK